MKLNHLPRPLITVPLRGSADFAKTVQPNSPDGHLKLTLEVAADGAWLIGAATNESLRELDVPLSFLPAGSYESLVIQDGPTSDYRTHAEDYQAATRTSPRPTPSASNSPPGGGACVLINPKR